MELSKMKKDICKYLIEGDTNEEIGEKLYISKHTVKAYVKSIIDEFKVKNRTELAYVLGIKHIEFD